MTWRSKTSKCLEERHSWQREQQIQRPGGRNVLGMLEKDAKEVNGTGEG